MDIHELTAKLVADHSANYWNPIEPTDAELAEMMEERAVLQDNIDAKREEILNNAMLTEEALDCLAKHHVTYRGLMLNFMMQAVRFPGDDFYLQLARKTVAEAVDAFATAVATDDQLDLELDA